MTSAVEFLPSPDSPCSAAGLQELALGQGRVRDLVIRPWPTSFTPNILVAEGKVCEGEVKGRGRKQKAQRAAVDKDLVGSD